MKCMLQVRVVRFAVITLAVVALVACGSSQSGDNGGDAGGSSSSGASGSSTSSGGQVDAGTADGGASSSSGASSSNGASSGGASSGGASSGGASSGASSSGASSSGTSSSGGQDAGGTDDSGSSGGASGSGSGGASGSGSGGASGSGSGGADAGAGGDDAGSSGGNDSGPIVEPPPKACEIDAAKGDTGVQCPTGFTCLAPGGACGGKVAGTCHKSVDVCTALVAPVCGCDKKTYSNLCLAQKAGAVVDKGGKCSEPVISCGGIAGKTCAQGQVCELKSCAADASGQCVAAPQAPCANGGVQECGCDGNTYPSACFRQKSGVALDYVGACLIPAGAKQCKIGPVKPLLCDNGQYCKVPVGACAGKGVCIKKPNVCDKSLKPVCGCNKKTYGNACLLEQSGFSVLATEPCPP